MHPYDPERASTSARPARGPAAKLGCSLAVLAGLLALIELGLRAAGYDPFGRMFAEAPGASREGLETGLMREVQGDPILVYELTPGASAYAWQADMRFNAKGFRDRDFPARTSSTFRILALGDSATFGVKLPAEVLWPVELERLFLRDGLQVEVFNLGIVGYDVLEEVALLEKHVDELDPDLVVLAYHPNDVGHVSATRTYINRLQSYGSPWYRIRILQYLRSRADEHELAREFQEVNTDEYFLEKNEGYIASLEDDPEVLELVAGLDSVLGQNEMAMRIKHRYLGWYTNEARVGKLRYSLERLRDMAREHAFEVALFVVPWLGDKGMESAYDRMYDIVRHETERAGFRFVPMVDATRSRVHAKLLIEKRDFGHPNATGHRVMAERLHQALGDSVR